MKNKRYIATMVGLLLMFGAGTTTYGQIVKGNVFGGGKLAKVNGGTGDAAACNVTVKSGSVYGKIYGAGEGVKTYEAGYHDDLARVTGDVKVNMEPGRSGGGYAWKDVFGGGALAGVTGNTFVNMSGGHIAANLFGGGEGDIRESRDEYNKLVITYANISGNTNVNITGGDIVWDRTSLATPLSVTTFTYTKTITFDSGTETYTTTDPEETADKIKTSFESANYTSVSVVSDGEPVDGVYSYTVTRTPPTIVLTEEVLSTNTTRISELVADGYVIDEGKTVETALAEGEIVYWDTDVRTSDYVNESDKSHKIHNELFYDEAKKQFRIKHNIFGGGYVACRVGKYDADGKLELVDGKATTGTANVNVSRGMFGVDLIGTDQWKQAYYDNQDPHFYVFGGGYGAYTSVANTKVQVGVADDENLGSGDSEQQWAKPGLPDFDITLAKGTHEEELGVADNTYGEPSNTILGVLGGGYAGIVTGNTDVHVDGCTFLHRIYGGGYGQLAAYNELTAADVIWTSGTTEFKREDLGMVMGNTKVVTDGGYIQGDVFGGGAGVKSAWRDGSTYKELDKVHTSADLDFNMGEVKGITKVEIAGTTSVHGSVYGGGDVAKVSNEAELNNSTTVTVKSGTVVDNVFGGGKGLKVAEVKGVADNAVTVGGVYGNTLVTIENVKDSETGEIVSEPYIYGSVYGGGDYGQVMVNGGLKGNTVVNVNGGNIGGDIFGGGHGDELSTNLTSANIAGDTKVTINGGSALWKSVTDANGNITAWDVKTNLLKTETDKNAVRLALLTGDSQMFKTILAGNVPANFFNIDDLTFKSNHNIYGGGDRVCVVGGNAQVIINHALVTDAELLDPSTAAGLCWAASIDNKEHPQFSVFGGGYGPNTTVNNTEVKYQCGNASTEYEAKEADTNMWNYYFKSISDRWTGSAESGNVTEDEKDEKYGGDNAAGIWRYAVSELAWSSGIPNLIMRGIFGGGYAGLVSGNAKVTVSDKSCMRYVYGGGLGSQDYLDYYKTKVRYQKLGEVRGNTTVNILGGVVSKEVYGGGAGIEPKKLGGDTEFTDLVDMARVHGKTSVTISGSPAISPEGASGTVIIGDVFGGGDVANVGLETNTIEDGDEHGEKDSKIDANDVGYFTSKVIINSGCMLGQVFAGGNGRTKELCSGADANGVFGYQKVGAVFGNTLLTVDGYDDTSVAEGHENITYVFKRMFGGGNNGSIRKTTSQAAATGHTYVTINGGYFAYNVFGGGVGTINTTTDENTGVVTDNNTYSYVEGDTHVRMLGGLAIVDQYWDKPTSVEVAPGKTIEIGMRQWAPINKKDGKKYSAQYDPYKHKLLINHNIYAGCRNAGYVLGSTYLTMNKGYIRSGLRAGAYEGVADNFFESAEWNEIYEKIGSPHFCIFGGGFGENTHVKGDTNVDIDIKNDGHFADYASLSGEHGRFEGGQSVMDIIGGGYSGDVAGATHVKVGGDLFARRIFGGSFYAPVSQTNIKVNSIYCDDIFGGGMMGDVTATEVKGYTLGSGCGNVNLVVGEPYDEGNPGDADNRKIFIDNVYGGNDVSGNVTGQITNSIFGGEIRGNVYGAGNGNYLYAINPDVKVVTTHEQYVVSEDEVLDLVYEVPKINDEDADFEVNMENASAAQKIVNINAYRPGAEHVILNLSGTETQPLKIAGNVFGGGNTATVSSATSTPTVEVNIGSYCNISGVYMGDDGDAMFQEANGFMDAFQSINGIDLKEQINWQSDPRNMSIPEKYLAVKKGDRPIVYPHVLDLYFQPVEMSIQPTLNWCSNIALTDKTQLTVAPTVKPTELTGTTIGIFVAGGNRGNMNVTPDADGSIVDYNFPAGLTITNRIVGGCNNANYDRLGNNIKHVGGYLLGKRYNGVGDARKPAINLTVECKFNLPEGETTLLADGKPLKDENGNPVEQRNVYGGCYNSGTINGDINIDFRSTMLNADNVGDDNVEKIAKTYFGSEIAMGNVYGAGYGSESYVYGNTSVTVGRPITVPVPDPDPTPAKGMKKTDPIVVNDYVAMSVYGGGQQGNVIGNTTVRVLNGHIGKSVVGGSYAGYMWGSTQVIVGYPTYYTAKQGGIYYMKRADKWNTDKVNHDGSKAVKDCIYLLPGDVVSMEVYDAIKEFNPSMASNFTEHEETPANWDDINITIDEACYGGGYSLANGSSVAVGTYTVKKYDDTMNITGDYDVDDDLKKFVNHEGNTSTKGYGGNTTVLVWDNNDPAQTTDHINISTQTMVEVRLNPGTDLFGYYYKDNKGQPHHIYQEDTYFYGTDKNDGRTYYQHAFESDSEGGMYGDGHLSFAEGFRAGELVGYGFSASDPSGAKIINTFQRMDMLRIKDCAVSVLGARDYTVNEISKTPYSIARIGELQMIAENVTGAPAKDGTLTSTTALAPISASHSRNYLGLSNNIHYVGAVKSNVDFNSTYHYGYKEGDSKYGKYKASTTYRQEKQDYVSNYIDDPATFQKRNDGTAANMIGISSGYALKVQNVKTVGDATTEDYFFGPIVGVVEMNLIDVREDEGGGYVYADNVHHRSATAFNDALPNYDQVPSAYDQQEDFLEVSGNFVFPYDEKKNRYIVDDCFPKGFDLKGYEATEEGHYWYVTGYNYYYNAHITGYTYDSSGENTLTFNSDKDGLLSLTGAKVGQKINLQSVKWRSNHITEPIYYTAEDIVTIDDKTYAKNSCVVNIVNDNEVYSLKPDGTSVEANVGDMMYDNKGFLACDLETPAANMPNEAVRGYGNDIQSSTDGHFVNNHYNLHVGTADDTDGKYPTDLTNHTYWTNLPMTAPLGSSTDRYLEGNLTKADPVITFQLEDNTNNSGDDYYTKYMQQPSQATVVLTCPATEKDGTTPVKGYVPISYFFTRSASPGADGEYVYTKVADGTTLDASTTYYYFGNGNTYHEVTKNKLFYYNKEQSRYVSVLGDAAVTEGTDSQKHPAGDPVTPVSGSSDYTFYDYADRMLTYTIYLTIDYVQGPDVKGNLRIYNCALPGEMIKIDKGSIEVKSDVAMSQNATMWKFKHGDKEYVFDQNNPYDEKAGENNTTSAMLKDVEYVEADKCIYVPAYYFMNGYKVEYWYRVSGIPQTFYAMSTENDYLTIHNYHRMKPINPDNSKADVDFKLDLAVERVKDEAEAVAAGTMNAKDALPEPRIYIANAADLNEFARFLGEDKYNCGENMQFHLLNNITMNDVGTANLQEDHYGDATGSTPVGAVDFKGTLNGNGYVITDLGVKKGVFPAPAYLFEQNHGNIYNLGLQSGVITKGDVSSNNPLYHTSYTWSNKTVYRADGAAVTSYTDSDFRYGKVAFDLNQFYLDHRKALQPITYGNSVLAKSNAPGLRMNPGVYDYVENLYANGDYLYARWMQDSDEFLRTNARPYDANYNSKTTSYHRYTFNPETYEITHPIDECRAVMNPAVEEDQEHGIEAKPETLNHYEPLYEETSLGHTGEDGKKTRNDYLFFGQLLNSTTAGKDMGTLDYTLPDHITTDKTHDVDLMTNRVYRAAGYYQSRAAGTRYETNGNAYYHNAAAYVFDNGITAIDFHDYYTEPAGYYYPPVRDYRLTSLSRADGVTRNLLVYADAATDTDATTGKLRNWAYNEGTAEGSVKMHIISPAATPTTEYLHLVERTSANEDASGAECLNNDFDAPIAFNVTKRAWYTRKPANYAESNNSAWEGIALPFTANKVTATLNGEITHFYGTYTGDNPAENDKNLHHEYWLRGLTAVTDNKATYQRPGVFNHDDMTAAKFGYYFKNTWFVDTYPNYSTYSSAAQNDWYTKEHTYAGYLPLTADIPYIVSFPGNRFYEFDLSSDFYNSKMPEKKAAQTVTFNNYVPADGSITVKATEGSQKAITAGGYDNKPTYLYMSDAEYGMNNGGTQFVNTQNEVLPFRTYLASAPSPAKHDVIYITGDVENVVESRAIEGESDERLGVQGMTAYAVKRTIVIDSDYAADIVIYTVGGQVARAVRVLEGNNVYSGFAPGVYLVNGKKLVVR